MNKITGEDIKELMGRTWGIESSDIPEDIKLNDTPYWDSLGHVGLLLELEKQFKISINYETLTQLTSLKKIMQFINKEGLSVF